MTRVADSVDLISGQAIKAKRSDGTELCLVRTGAGVFAIEDSCTHAYFPMSDGDVVGDCEIECALHGAKFDLRDGSVLSAPATDALKTYRVMEQDGGIWVGEQLGGSGE